MDIKLEDALRCTVAEYEDLFKSLSSLTIDQIENREVENYLREDFFRFLITVAISETEADDTLEIGANPYFTSVLLAELTGKVPRMTNSFGETSATQGVQTVQYDWVSGQTSAPRTHDFEFQVVNVEKQPLPWPDETFDQVLYCEVIEHLLMDPMRSLLEIHRVLKPNGTLIVTTPNVARTENILRMIHGHNLYDPYSGHGPYGRHNREFTRHELVSLVGHCGFHVEQHFTADVRFGGVDNNALDLLAPLLPPLRQNDLGQYLFTKSRKSKEPSVLRPVEIYRSLEQTRLGSWG